MTALEIAKALGNEKRLLVMQWLRDPTTNFPPQVDGDLVIDGVCGLLIARRLGVSQATASQHLKVLTDVGILRAKRMKQWTFYKRDEKRIAEAKKLLKEMF